MRLTEDAEERVLRLRRRLGVLLVLERGLRRAAAAGFVWGAVVLAARAGLGAEGSWMAIGLAATLAVAAAAAAVEGWRSRPSTAAVRALLDRRQGHGGLLMAGVEADLGAWRGELRGAAVPRVTWRARPAAWLAAGAAAFVTVAFLAPARVLEAAARRPLDVGREIQELARDLEVLAEEGLLEIEEKESLAGELETLADEATGEDPARTWEGLDHLRDVAERTADEAAEAAFGEGERLAAAAEVAEALGDSAGADPELRAAALRELAELAARAAAEERLLDAATAQALTAAAERGDLGELRAALEQGRAGLADALERLHDAGLIDLETLLAARRSLAAEDAELSDFLDQNGLEASGELWFGRFGRPGRGGVDRGRGDAPMTWQEPISSEGASFEEQALDPASLAALERSSLIGLQAAAPPLAEGRPAAGVSAPQPGEAAGGGAFTQTVLPRHRGAVRRFFARTDESKTDEDDP